MKRGLVALVGQPGLSLGGPGASLLGLHAALALCFSCMHVKYRKLLRNCPTLFSELFCSIHDQVTKDGVPTLGKASCLGSCSESWALHALLPAGRLSQQMFRATWCSLLLRLSFDISSTFRTFALPRQNAAGALQALKADMHALVRVSELRSSAKYLLLCDCFTPGNVKSLTWNLCKPRLPRGIG